MFSIKCDISSLGLKVVLGYVVFHWDIASLFSYLLALPLGLCTTYLMLISIRPIIILSKQSLEHASYKNSECSKCDKVALYCRGRVGCCLILQRRRVSCIFVPADSHGITWTTCVDSADSWQNIGLSEQLVVVVLCRQNPTGHVTHQVAVSYQ